MWKLALRWFLTGMAMGCADVVPGVSGGTMAYISGIYNRLMTALSSIDVTAVKLLFKGKIKQLWKHVDANFLCLVFAGILSAIFLLAGMIDYCLEHYPPVVWSFFSGLILCSGALLLKQVPINNLIKAGFFVLGVAFVVSITFLKPTEVEAGYAFIFFGGMIAITAMILPGISGSMILLLIGLYGPVIEAVHEFQIDILAVMAFGCITGLLVFPRILNYLLTKFHDYTMAGLTGIVLGSLFTIWPWRFEGQVMTPSGYEIASNLSGFIGSALVFFIIGMLLVWCISFLSKK